MNELTVKTTICVIIGIIIFLPIWIIAKWNKKRKPICVNRNSFAMYYKKSFVFMMVVYAIMGFFMVIVFIVLYNNSFMLAVIALVLTPTLIMAGAAIYGLLWRAVVDENSITIYSPFFPVKHYMFCDITELKEIKDSTVKDRLTAYIGRKKIFAFDDDIVGFRLLQEQFFRAGKLKPMEIKENFIVKCPKDDLVRDLVGVIMFNGLFLLLIYYFFFLKEKIDYYFYIIFLFLQLYILWSL